MVHLLKSVNIKEKPKVDRQPWGSNNPTVEINRRELILYYFKYII